jgi:hypothetical protein
MDMIVYVRTVLILAIGLVPFLLYEMADVVPATQRQLAENPGSSGYGEMQADLALVEMNRGVESKARELREIDVKILETKGSILKLEENKQAFVNELEAIQHQIQRVIKGAKIRKE